MLFRSAHVHAERKPVEKLGSQVALFGVHCADEHETRRVAEADSLPLDHVDAHRRGVEQQVNHVIVQQVDLIHVEQTAVGCGQHARLEVALAPLDRFLDVERTDDAVFGRADGQIHEAGAPLRDRQRLAARQAVAAVVAEGLETARIAGEGAIGHHLDLGQQIGQGAGRGGLGRAALAKINTPPIALMMAFRIKARFMRS